MSAITRLLENASPDARRANQIAIDREARVSAGLAKRFDDYVDAKSEKELHQQIAGLLRREGVEWMGHGSMAHKTKYTVGWPDFVIPLPTGKTLYWEVKYGEGKVRPEQAECIDWLQKCGHSAKVIRSYSEALTALREAIDT